MYKILIQKKFRRYSAKFSFAKASEKSRRSLLAKADFQTKVLKRSRIGDDIVNISLNGQKSICLAAIRFIILAKGMRNVKNYSFTRLMIFTNTSWARDIFGR